MNLFENHHLIPESLKSHPVFLALRRANMAYDRFTLKMPTAAAAAQSSQIASAPPVDGVHRGGHYAAYTEAVKRYLDKFELR